MKQNLIILLISLALVSSQQWAGVYQVNSINSDSLSCCLPADLSTVTVQTITSGSTTAQVITTEWADTSGCTSAQLNGETVSYILTVSGSSATVDVGGVTGSVSLSGSELTLSLADGACVAKGTLFTNTPSYSWAGTYTTTTDGLSSCCYPSGDMTISSGSGSLLDVSWSWANTVSCNGLGTGVKFTLPTPSSNSLNIDFASGSDIVDGTITASNGVLNFESENGCDATFTLQKFGSKILAGAAAGIMMLAFIVM